MPTPAALTTGDRLRRTIRAAAALRGIYDEDGDHGLAATVGIHRDTMQKWWNDKTTPTVVSLMRVAKGLDLPIALLLAVLQGQELPHLSFTQQPQPSADHGAEAAQAWAETQDARSRSPRHGRRAGTGAR